MMMVAIVGGGEDVLIKAMKAYKKGDNRHIFTNKVVEEPIRCKTISC